MEPRISRILEDCLARINNGESVAACLADNAELRDQLEPLLNTALKASALPKVSPSIEFRQTSRLRLLNRLKQEQQAGNSAATATANAGETISGWRALWHGLSPAKRVAIVVAIVVLSALAFAVTWGPWMIAQLAFISRQPWLLELREDHISRTLFRVTDLPVRLLFAHERFKFEYVLSTVGTALLLGILWILWRKRSRAGVGFAAWYLIPVGARSTPGGRKSASSATAASNPRSRWYSR